MFSEMSLPPDRLAPHFVSTRYEVLKPLPAYVRRGSIDPGSEEVGLPNEYFFPGGIDELVKAHYLKPVP
jgi:hypothetical protein